MSFTYNIFIDYYVKEGKINEGWVLVRKENIDTLESIPYGDKKIDVLDLACPLDHYSILFMEKEI